MQRTMNVCSLHVHPKINMTLWKTQALGTLLGMIHYDLSCCALIWTHLRPLIEDLDPARPGRIDLVLEFVNFCLQGS